MCGNYNGNMKDDFQTRSKYLASSELEFVNSWKESPLCGDTTFTLDPCSLNTFRRSWAERKCGIINSQTFAACHGQVPPQVPRPALAGAPGSAAKPSGEGWPRGAWPRPDAEGRPPQVYRLPYYEACVRDACGCDAGGDCECLCDAVAAYAQACLDKGVCVDWRSPDFCRESRACPEAPAGPQAACPAAALLPGRAAPPGRHRRPGPAGRCGLPGQLCRLTVPFPPAIYCDFYNTHTQVGGGKYQYAQEANCTWHYQPCLCPEGPRSVPGANIEGTGRREGDGRRGRPGGIGSAGGQDVEACLTVGTRAGTCAWGSGERPAERGEGPGLGKRGFWLWTLRSACSLHVPLRLLQLLPE